MENQRFGAWVVIEKTSKRANGNILWNCQCDCGVIRLVRATALNRGKSLHCGCKTGEINRDHSQTHGLSRGSHNSIYLIWQGIKNRCLNEKAFAYKDYGGRGIKICEEWLNFENFYRDMLEGYEKGLTIERNNVNGNYEKSNCKWITRAEQANNRRTTIYMDTELGIMKIKDAAKLVGICWQAMYTRYKHWPKERWLEKAR